MRYNLPELLDVRSFSIHGSKINIFFFTQTAEGTQYTLRLLSRDDLNRQIVRSGSCEVFIRELELTLPPTNRGQLTTVEGLLQNVVADLSMDQPLRRIQDEDGWKKVEELLDKIRAILGSENDEDEDEESRNKTRAEKDADLPPMNPFTLKLDDPSGNSFIEFVDSMADPKWNLRTYIRTLDQNIALGLVGVDDEDARKYDEMKQRATMQAQAHLEEVENREEVVGKDGSLEAITDDEIFVFPGVCSSCGHPIETNMKKVNIPYFKVSFFFRHFFLLSLTLKFQPSGHSDHVDQL